MMQTRIEFPEGLRDARRAGHARSPWLASGALCLALLCLSACAGTTGAESAEELEEREAESSAEEEGNRRN